MRYPAYESYKDSGVEWIGNIPSSWNMWKIVHVCPYVASGTTPSSDSIEYYGGETLWITTGELRETIIFDTKKKVTSKALMKFPTLRIHPAGSVAIAMYGATIGRLGILGVEATTNQACCVMPPSDKIFNKYLFYWLLATRQEIINLSSGGGQPNVNQEKIASLKVSAPSYSEQIQIAAFLDRETAVIDTLIAKQEELIRLLGEKRTAVISHAVTKGLNPHATLKDSGIEWLGQIPAHWEASKPKYFTKRIVDGVHHTPNYVDEGVPFVTVKNLTATRRGISFQDTKFITQETHEKLLLRANPEQGDILITKDGTLGVTRVIDTDREFSIFVSVALIKPITNKIDSYFLRYVLESEVAIDQFEARKQGSGLKHLHLEEIANISITLPPLQEQKTIVDYIEEKIGKLDELFGKVEEAIELLKERRTALISAAVTGKIDVRQP